VNEAKSPEDYISVIYRMAVAAPPFLDSRYFKLFEQVLANQNAKVRDAAVLAIGYVGWPEFRNILEQMKTSDPDQSVQESAAIMSDGYKLFKISQDNPIQPFSGTFKTTEIQSQNLETPKRSAHQLSNAIASSHSQESKKFPEQTLIFKETVSRKEVIDFANSNKWLLKASQEADPDEYLPFEIAWVTPDQQTAIHYLEDWHIQDYVVAPYCLKTPYLIIEGQSLEEVTSLIRSSFNTYPGEEILRWIATAKDLDDLIEAIIHLGYTTSKDFDARSFDALQKALSHCDTRVRLAAIWASGGTGWLEFQRVLENLSISDPSEDVQQEATHMLQIFEIEVQNRLLKVLT
jgi:hypothetical protein